MDSQQSDAIVEDLLDETLQDNSALNQLEEMMDYLYHPILNNSSELLNFSIAIIQNSDPFTFDDTFSDSEYLNLDDSSSDSGYEEMDDDDSLRFQNVFDLYSAIRNYDSVFDHFMVDEMQSLINIVDGIVQNSNIDEIFHDLNIPQLLNEHPEHDIELLRTAIMFFISDSNMLNDLYNRTISNSLDEPVRNESLPKEIFESLPVTTVDDKLMSELESCVICVENYSLGDNILLLPCKHVFHTQCIKRWFEIKSNCPLCLQLVDHS